MKKKWTVLYVICLCLALTPLGASAYNQSDRIQPLKDTWKLPHKTYQTTVVDFTKSKDQAWAIQLALNEAKENKTPTKVVVPQGTYELKRPLRVYSNTWLQAEKGTVFLREHNQSMLINGDYGATYSKYNGHSNIILDGGTWDLQGDSRKNDGSAFALSHGENLLIQHVTVKDVYYSHAMDLAGDSNVIVRDSKFVGFFDDGTRGFAEAIQVDITASFNSFSEFGSYDQTPSQNIRVENNYFGNSSTKGAKVWGTGVGSHSAVSGIPYSNIQILHNQFDGMNAHAVHAYGWEDVMIYQNTMKSTYEHVLIESPINNTKENRALANFSVLENKVMMNKTNKTSILLKGKENADLLNTSIKDNVFYGLKNGQNRADWSNVKHLVFEDNTIAAK